MIEVCRCGNKPIVGGWFKYKSKYNDDGVTKGIILSVSKNSIVSTNYVNYHKDDIEVESLIEIRENKLNNILK